MARGSKQEDVRERSNHLLTGLSPADRTALTPHLRLVQVGSGRRFVGHADEGEDTYFPVTLVASVLQVMPCGANYDIGLIGSEGVIGWPAGFGFAPMPFAGVVQLAGGTALAIRSDVLARVCDANPQLHAVVLRFIQSFAVQMSHTIVAGLRHGVEARLARWLLMLHDRVDGDYLRITHSALARTLNVRRASITDTLHLLEGHRIVHCTRGEIAIRDRAALTEAAGDSYGPAEANYRALIGPFGKA